MPCNTVEAVDSLKKSIRKRLQFMPLALGLLVLCFRQTAHAAELTPFTSVGCSLFPGGTLFQQKLWLDCCTAPDQAYLLGGS
ncbi:MAG: hypothetical protein KDI30_02275, partial [Pseudomonadales bacterium]|nr:hypothetical protein [Pseudomonadales bacterium]